MIEKLLEFKLAYEVSGIVFTTAVLVGYIICHLIIIFGRKGKKHGN